MVIRHRKVKRYFDAFKKYAEQRRALISGNAFNARFGRKM